jgi:hypothetical protein
MPRNVSGTYTLPLPPVVPATVIQAAWANTTTDDIAQGITDSLDRQGRGGMIAPFRLVDGAAASPALSFSAETGTGLYRQGAGIMSVSIMGVKVGQWSSTGYTGALAGPFNLTGDVSFTGRGLFADGTLALPSISFTSDPDTGIYKSAVGELAFGVDATKKLVMNASSLQVSPSPTASAPSLLIFAGINAGSAGYTIDMLGSGVGTDKVIVRWLNNGYTIERFSIVADTAGVVLGVPGALPISITTSNTTRLVIDAAGNARFSGPLVAAPNFWVAETGAGAGTVGIAAGAGASTVYWGNSTGGLGAMDIYAGGFKQAQFASIASAVNYWTIYGGSAGNRPAMEVRGSDASIGMAFTTKGSGDVAFFGPVGLHLQLVGAGATWVQFSGNTGATPNYPAIGSNAAKINATVPMRFTGAISTVGDLANQYSQASFAAYSIVDSTRAANAKVAEIIFTGGGFQARFLNDLNNDARTIWNSNGGVTSTGIANTLHYTGNNDLTMYLYSAGTAGNLGRVDIGPMQPWTQLQVTGTAQETAAIFDPSLVPAKVGSTIYLADQGAAGGNGGVIMFGAFPTPTAAGNHFASIRGFITDASNRTAGELRFQTKDTSADTGSTQALRITANKTLYDNRDLPIARDPGATAGAVSSTNLPIGSIVLGSPTTTLNNNALSILDASLNNIRIWASGSGTNATITNGNWRQCGAVSSTGQTMLFIRV